MFRYWSERYDILDQGFSTVYNLDLRSGRLHNLLVTERAQLLLREAQRFGHMLCSLNSLGGLTILILNHTASLRSVCGLLCSLLMIRPKVI